MSAQHTPGQWRTDMPGPYELRIVAPNGQVIAKIWLDDAPVEDYNNLQHANARRIVQCVNAHDELERDNQRLSTEVWMSSSRLNALLLDRPAMPERGEFKSNADYLAACRAALNRHMGTAIAKATGSAA